MQYKKFMAVIEIEIDIEKYQFLEKENIIPSDHIACVISNHARDRGFIMRTSVTEIEHGMLDRVRACVDKCIIDDTMKDLADIALTNNLCINCNDEE